MSVFLKCFSRVRILSAKDFGYSTEHFSNSIHLNCRRCVSRQVAPDKIESLTYNDVQKYRRDEAYRSVLILQLRPSQELADVCQKYGDINKIFQIKRNDKYYLFVEYKTASSLSRLKSNVSQFPNLRRVPMQSHFLYYRPTSNRFDHKIQRAISCDFDVNRLTDDDLQLCSTVNSQINMLHKKLSMSEVDVRLRYFVCGEVERFLRRLFPGSVVNLFGSSVNGCGRFDCDVDMNFDLESGLIDQNIGNVQMKTLYYLTKLKPDSDRIFSQKTLEIVGGLIQHFMPQMINVRRILRARIPIVKFSNVAMNIDCDLCLENRTAVHMSEILFQVCRSDDRVAPLIFTVRHWARCSGITQPNPGPWLSNFMLTLLVVYSLQTNLQPILPPLKILIEDGAKKNKNSSKNCTQTLEDLLMYFFKFYAELDFSQSAISVIDGCLFPKPDQSALYIYNPVENGLNVGKNVLESHLEQFQALCRSTHEALQSTGKVTASGIPWGIMTILKADLPAIDKDGELNSGHVTSDETQEEEPVEDFSNANSSNSNEPILKDSDVDVNSKKSSARFNLSMESILAEDIGDLKAADSK